MTTAALPGSLTAAAHGALAAVDVSAAGAAAQATFKLVALCGVVAWLSHRGSLPSSTSRVLSQVAFTVSIPCMLLRSTMRTAASGDAAAFAAVPLIAASQVLLGLLLGWEAARAVEGRSPLARALLGWRELHPTPEAAAIAASAAAAIGAPAAIPALLPRNSGVPPGIPLLVGLACAFGNCLALPTLYLSSMLPPEELARAAACTAVCYSVWSPMLWLFGYGKLKRQQLDEELGPEAAAARRQRRAARGLWWRLLAWRQRFVSAIRPGSGDGASPTSKQQPGGATVLLTKQLPGSFSGGGAASRGGGGGRPVYVAADEADPEESPAEALFKRAWRVIEALFAVPAAALHPAARRAREVLNPPVAAALLGAALGLSPLAPLLLDPSAAAAAVAAAPPRTAWELGLLLGAARALWELVEMMAGAMLATMMLVFATTLFGRRPLGGRGAEGASAAGRGAAAAGRGAGGGGGGSSSSSEEEDEGEGDGAGLEVERVGGMTTITVRPSAPLAPTAGPGGGYVRLTQRGAETPDDAGASVLQQLRPRGAWEWRAAAAVGAVRFLLMPLLSAVLVLGAAAAGLLPRDPAVLLALMLQGTMPPAQALVVMLQLPTGPGRAKGGRGGGGDGALAGASARLTLQLYAVSALPVTLWASWFASAAAAAAAGAG